MGGSLKSPAARSIEKELSYLRWGGFKESGFLEI
jgi:hypothetical protein